MPIGLRVDRFGVWEAGGCCLRPRSAPVSQCVRSGPEADCAVDVDVGAIDPMGSNDDTRLQESRPTRCLGRERGGGATEIAPMEPAVP